jgi:hypothetical protein
MNAYVRCKDYVLQDALVITRTTVVSGFPDFATESPDLGKLGVTCVMLITTRQGYHRS